MAALETTRHSQTPHSGCVRLLQVYAQSGKKKKRRARSAKTRAAINTDTAAEHRPRTQQLTGERRQNRTSTKETEESRLIT